MPVDSPSNVFLQHEKDEMYVGPHTRPSGHTGVAYIDSRELADSYAAELLPVYERRYGKGVELKVEEVSGTLRAKEKARMRDHSDIIHKRIATQNFAPNKKVSGL